MDLQSIKTDLAKLGEDVKKGFRALAARREQCELRLAEIRGRLEEARGEYRAVRWAPGTREDFLAALCEQVSRVAREGQSRRVKALHGHIGGGKPNVQTAEFQRQHFAAGFLSDMLEGGKDFEWFGTGFICANRVNQLNLNGHLDYVSICTMFEEQIKAGLRASLDRIEWPYPEAVSKAERDARLEKIQQEIERLEQLETELVEMLDSTKT